MAATIISKAGVTLLFAIDASIQAIAGYIVQSDTQDSQSKMTDAVDANGSTLAVAFYDFYKDIDFVALLESGTALPAVGSSVTVNSVLYAVLPPVSQREVNTKFTEVTIKLRHWTDNVIPNV